MTSQARFVGCLAESLGCLATRLLRRLAARIWSRPSMPQAARDTLRACKKRGGTRRVTNRLGADLPSARFLPPACFYFERHQCWRGQSACTLRTFPDDVRTQAALRRAAFFCPAPTATPQFARANTAAKLKPCRHSASLIASTEHATSVTIPAALA